MSEWLKKISDRTDLTTNPGQSGGGGSNVPGIAVFPGQSQLFSPPYDLHKKRKRRKGRGSNKKINP